MILDIIAMVAVSAIATFFLILLIVQRKSRLEILEKYVRSEIEKSIIVEKLEEAIKENELKNIEGSDGFLKFVSDSREWAFKYIEDVQEAFAKFDNLIAPDLDYADRYGLIDMDTPSKHALARINKAYKELKGMLPQDMVK
jgi:hypothetical protein